MEAAYNNLLRRRRGLCVCIPLTPVQPVLVNPFEDLRHTPSSQRFPQIPLSPSFRLPRAIAIWEYRELTLPRTMLTTWTAGAPWGWTVLRSIPRILSGLKLSADEVSLITIPPVLPPFLPHCLQSVISRIPPSQQLLKAKFFLQVVFGDLKGRQVTLDSTFYF